MLKAIFSRSGRTEDATSESMESATVALMNRVTQVLQATARNQEKFSTLANLRPFSG